MTEVRPHLDNRPESRCHNPGYHSTAACDQDGVNPDGGPSLAGDSPVVQQLLSLSTSVFGHGEFSLPTTGKVVEHSEVGRQLALHL